VRSAVNDNPVVQIAVLGVLAVIVAFLLMTRVLHKSSTTAPPTTTPATSAAPAVAGSTAPTTPSPTAGATATPSPAAGTTAPSPTADGTVPPATTPGAAPVAPAAPIARFVSGRGLPAPVVAAYKDDKTVVLLVVKFRGIDDDALRATVDRLRGRPDLAVFVTYAAHISRYARITAGVDVNRVPALVVLRPRHLTHATPTALVSYGFRGPASVDQAIRDAGYKGPTNLPYYPK
jgi:hypothetical protein